MQDFPLYFRLGLEHILDLQGYDHILFVCALCGVYLIEHFKKILFLVTAFTIGHCLTLALSVFEIVKINTSIIEFLIPCTIAFTALSNILTKQNKPVKEKMMYLMALFFGLIHGLGFSNYLKSLLGKNTSIVSELFAFNIGLEVGQLIIVTFILIIATIFINLFKVKQREWNLFLSSAIFGIAIMMAVERLPPLIN